MSQVALPYTLEGTVIHGDKIGRTLDFPTANLDVLPPAGVLTPGVYLGSCQVLDQEYACLTYYGPRLVLGEEKNQLEVWMYDFNQFIYGQRLKVTMTDFIREPLPFSSLEALKAQLYQDKKAGQLLLESSA
jgi:riboflavin kinase/FMN adenylyltransferase